MDKLDRRLDQVILQSSHFQTRIQNLLNNAKEQWRPGSEFHQFWQQCTEKLKDVITKLMVVCHEKILVNPYVERCQEYARQTVLNLYKKCLPYLAKLTENSALAASLGFCLGVVLTAWALSIYYHSYYNSIIKTRTMSGVTFDEKNCLQGLESLSLRSDLLVPKITSPTQVLVRIHAGSVDAVDIAILSGLGRCERRMFRTGTGNGILGRDFSGVVLDVGKKVKNVDVGDAVWSALPIAANNGALCEFVVVESNQLCLRPTKLSHDGAATLPYACLKVWDALVNQGNIKPIYGLRDKHVLIVDGGSPTGVVALQVAKAWQGHVTVCVHHRVSPLVTLLGADQVISLPHDPEKAEIKCKDIFNSEDSLFDLCIITSEDSLLSEEFCQEYSDILVKSCSERRLASDAYGWFRRKLLYYWRKLVWSSTYHKLDVKPLDYFKKLVDTGKLQPVLDSAYAYEQAEEAFQATATTSNIGKTIVTFGLRGHMVGETSNRT